MNRVPGSHTQTWRSWLLDMIADSNERRRIADELGINPATLTRWAHNESHPRQQNLRQLLKVLPQHREVLLSLIQIEYPTFVANDMQLRESEETRVDVIPGEFYIRVLRTLATTPKIIRYPTLGNLILEQALKHLDPDRVGVGISIARCLPPAHEDSVSSLLVDLGKGNPPWSQNMDNESMLLGAESLAGYAVISARTVAISNLLSTSMTIPASVGMWERSAVAAPIMFETRVAGSLLVSSVLTDYFTPEQLLLVNYYADLVALAFEPVHFYDPQDIQLKVFPTQQEQQPTIRGFRKRVSDIMRMRQPITIGQAELLAWQQIEEELLQLQLSKQTIEE
jgi:transcriptional regulator with XRE-family HTH domain